MSIKLWFELVSVGTLLVLSPSMFRFYNTGKKNSKPNSSFKDCMSNGITGGTMLRAVFCSFITTFFCTAGIILILSLISSSPSAKYQVTIGDLHELRNYYWYHDDKLGSVDLSSNEEVAFIKNELETNPSDCYDTLNIKKECVDVSFDEFLDYYFVTRPINELGIKYTCSVDRHTSNLSVQGVLKTDIEKGVTTYRIGDYTLYGEDDDEKIGTLSNNAEVKLDISYDTSTERISHYKIVSAKTI